MRRNFLRYLISFLFLFIALNAFGGGFYGMSGAKDIPIQWLERSPFKNYFIPSFILFILVGGSSLTASISVFKKFKTGKFTAFFSAIIILVWIVVQVLIIGFVSWMQPAIAGLSLIILILSIILYKNK
jgi:hypothetical protein